MLFSQDIFYKHESLAISLILVRLLQLTQYTSGEKPVMPARVFQKTLDFYRKNIKTTKPGFFSKFSKETFMNRGEIGFVFVLLSFWKSPSFQPFSHLY